MSHYADETTSAKRVQVCVRQADSMNQPHVATIERTPIRRRYDPARWGHGAVSFRNVRFGGKEYCLLPYGIGDESAIFVGSAEIERVLGLEREVATP